MDIKSIKLGDVTIKNNLFLAPMAGFTDFALRKIASDYGAGLLVTELVSAKGIIYKAKGTKDLLHTVDDGLTSAQIFGSDPVCMKEAILSEDLAPFPIIDINMGCPVPKIIKNGEGSALLAKPDLAEKIVKECVKTGKIITVKIRTGLKQDNLITEEFCKMLEGAGASLITIHGRTREMYYSGDIFFDEIKKAKKAVKIPIIANGSIVSKETADEMMEKTGADGVMIGRGAMIRPYIFSQLQGIEYDFNLKETLIKHLDLLLTKYPDKRVAINFRKFLPYYLKGMNVKELRVKANMTETTSELKELFNEYL
ncbi:MAG: tRNA-dihydrouridine synthase family protein [Clostridiales bacterium]|nr:tRNA-dihydrouridine synthase family protein [Clostridiales bacterium]